MLQAMNTGHDDSLATGHSNSPRDMIFRLETMVLMAGIDLPVRAIREQIAGVLDLIIQQSRLKDGSRKIINITEVQGLEGDVIFLQDMYNRIYIFVIFLTNSMKSKFIINFLQKKVSTVESALFSFANKLYGRILNKHFSFFFFFLFVKFFYVFFCPNDKIFTI